MRSIPNEHINGEGYWTSFGNDEKGEPITLNTWLDALAPRAWAVVAAGRARRTAASTRWPATRRARWASPTISGGDFRSKAGLPIVNVPGCPIDPDNFMETLLWVLREAAGNAPTIPLYAQLLARTRLFGKTVHEGCDRAGATTSKRTSDRTTTHPSAR